MCIRDSISSGGNNNYDDGDGDANANDDDDVDFKGWGLESLWKWKVRAP